MINRKEVIHVYAVLRYDKYLPGSDIPQRITVKEIHPTLEIAQAEVDRLNQLTKSKGGESIYWWCTTRWRSGPLPGMVAQEGENWS